MNVFFEAFYLILKIFSACVERAYRLIIPLPRKKIDGEVVLITGGGGGIGECIGMEMTKLNVKIVLWDINEEANNRVAEKLREQGATVFAFRCDITNKDEVYRVAEEVKNQVGHVTILVNNAGVLYCHPFLKCSDKLLRRQVEVNSVAHFWTTGAFLPHMLEINHGHIVTVASLAGIFGTPNLVGYCVSKFGAVGFHESMRVELLSQGKSGVKTTCVCPFFVDTPLLSNTKITQRFPSLFPLLKPDFVAKELVNGMLRDEGYVILPKTMTLTMMLQCCLPQKAMNLVGDFLAVRMDEDDPNQTGSENKEEQKEEKEDKEKKIE